VNWFQNLTIRTKVMLTFAIVLAVTTLLGVFAIGRLSTVNDGAVKVSSNYLVASNELGAFRYNTTRFRQMQASYFIATTPEEKTKERAKQAAQLESAKKHWAAYEPTIDAGAETEIAGKIQPLWSDYLAMEDKFEQLADSKSPATAEFFTKDMSAAFNKFNDALQADLDYQVQSGQKIGQDIQDTYSSSRTLIIAVLSVAALLCVALGWLIVSGVSTPVRAMTGAMTRLAQHDLTTEINGIGRKDEVGQMAAAVQVFKTSMIDADRLKQEQEEAQRLAARRSAVVDELTRNFDQKVQGVVQGVASQAGQMQASAQSLSATAEETTKQASAVAAASEQSAANVQTVAAATEELSSSIAEISRQVSHSSRIAGNAVSEAGKANEMVQGLLGASQKIGEVIALINDIADQTNLLALNATIEAARAGEAGKGFAVVAAEVKNLAAQTSKATEEIGAQIAGVQGATQDAVKAIASIGKTISEIDQIAATIAAAVEEQGAATQEIARNVEEAAKGTQEVSSNIGGVTEAANGTGAAAGQVLTAARSLSGQSEEMRELVQKFLTQVKAA